MMNERLVDDHNPSSKQTHINANIKERVVYTEELQRS